jgi:hypothetical protein
MKNIISFMFSAMLLLMANRGYAACIITNSVYRDVNGRGFELTFKPSSPSSSTTSVIATLSHAKRGKIFEFDMIQSQYYGSVSLINHKNNNTHLINFFNSNLTQSSIFRAESSPMYLFISGLGSTDYYNNQMSGSRAIILGDVMWKFQSCR